jgi:hypothetical protein
MPKNTNLLKELMEMLNPVRFQLADGRPLEIWGAHRNPDDGVLVIELVNTAEMDRHAAEIRAGSSRIARFWTRVDVERLLRMLFGEAASPELVNEYIDSHGLQHFGGMAQLEIDSEYDRFLESKRGHIQDVTGENAGKPSPLFGIKEPRDEPEKDPGDSRIAGSRSDPVNEFNPDA